ncbi:MAG: tetratricopeptide repeat protein [Candidatus Omnitrophota bacterium]
MKRKILFIMVIMVGFLPNVYAQDNLKSEYDKLKKEYEKVVADRDNVLTQSKNLLEYKAKYLEVDVQIKKLQDEKNKLQVALDASKSQSEEVEKSLGEENAALKKGAKELQDQINLLAEEKLTLKNAVDKLEIDYKVVPETRKEISRLQNDKRDLLRKYSGIEAKLKRYEERKLDADAQIEVYRRQVKEFKRRYEESMLKNHMLEKKAEAQPARIAEIARENKVLIKETALMHYNLGVFYTKNKEHARAIAEFEKAVELNPDDAASHYNIGYIYSEYLVNRPKAIEHFRKYLSLTKGNDKDVDWVKKYILTWQTWEGKKPMN